MLAREMAQALAFGAQHQSERRPQRERTEVGIEELHLAHEGLTLLSQGAQ